MSTLPKHLRTGISAERRGEEFLVSSGRRKVLCRNFRLKVGELDLVLEEELSPGTLELVFVEIRARTRGCNWVDGIGSVDHHKRVKLRRAIAAFLQGYRGEAQSARLDLLAWDGERWTHLRNVW